MAALRSLGAAGHSTLILLLLCRMYYVYLLQSSKHPNRRYIGFTEDCEQESRPQRREKSVHGFLSAMASPKVRRYICENAQSPQREPMPESKTSHHGVYNPTFIVIAVMVMVVATSIIPAVSIAHGLCAGIGTQARNPSASPMVIKPHPVACKSARINPLVVSPSSAKGTPRYLR